MFEVYKTGSYIKASTIKTIATTPLKNLPAFLQNEVAFLNKKYPNITTLKRVFTHIRNELKQANLTIKKLDKCLAFYKLNPKQLQWFENYTAQKLLNKRGVLTAINDPKGLIDCLKKLLKSNNKIELLIAIAGLTGRRVAEVGCSAKFIVNNQNNLLFSGQLKTKGRDDVETLIIPCLTNSHDLVKTHTKLLSILGDLDPEKFHNTYSRSISTSYHQHFSVFYNPPHQVKDLRAFYAEYCYLTQEPLVAKTKYFSQILGHGIDDATTGNHYEKFKLFHNPQK
jgi:hypothetical protein